MKELQKERNLCDQLADALRRLDLLYRSEYDHPIERPTWLTDALRSYEESLERDKVFCVRCGRLLPPDAGNSAVVCYMGTGCNDHFVNESENSIDRS